MTGRNRYGETPLPVDERQLRRVYDADGEGYDDIPQAAFDELPREGKIHGTTMRRSLDGTPHRVYRFVES
jgi:hypothetical protein